MSDSRNPVVGERYGLGLQPHAADPRDLQLADYWDYEIAPMRTPETANRYGHADLVSAPGAMGILLNDRVGDCFPADTAHALEVLDLLGGHKPNFDDASIGRTYTALSGWNGVDEGKGTDVGCEPRAGLKHFQKVGIYRADGSAERIGAYLWLEKGNPEQLEAATKAFDWTGIAYELTQNAETEADEKRWRYVPGSPKIGGHWVAVVGGEDDGEFDTLSWAMVIAVERLYYERCSVAAATSLSHSQLNGEGETPEGLDFEKLQHDMAALRA